MSKALRAAVVAVVVVLAVAGCSFTLYADGKPGIVMNRFSMTFARTPLPETKVTFYMHTVVRPVHLSGRLELQWWDKPKHEKGEWLDIRTVKIGLVAVPDAGHTDKKTFEALCLEHRRERLEAIFHARWPSGPPSDDTLYFPNRAGKSTGTCGGPIL